jgi:hypothetical protein
MIHREDVLAELYFKMAARTIMNDRYDRQIGELVAMLERPDLAG